MAPKSMTLKVVVVVAAKQQLCKPNAGNKTMKEIMTSNKSCKKKIKFL